MSLALNEPINGVNQLLEYRWTRKNWKLSTCNWLDLETLGHWLIMPKNSPRTLEWSDDFEFYLWNQPMQNGKIDQLPTKVPSTLLIDLHIQCNLGVLQILLGYLMHWPGHRPITALKSKTPLLNHQEQCCKSQKKKKTGERLGHSIWSYEAEAWAKTQWPQSGAWFAHLCLNLCFVNILSKKIKKVDNHWPWKVKQWNWCLRKDQAYEQGSQLIGPNLQRGWDIFSRTGLFQSPTGRHSRLVFGGIGTKLRSTHVVPRHVCWMFLLFISRSPSLSLSLSRSIHIDHDVICVCTRLFLKWRNAQLDAMGSRANLWIFFPRFVIVGPTTEEVSRLEISSSKIQKYWANGSALLPPCGSVLGIVLGIYQINHKPGIR